MQKYEKENEAKIKASDFRKTCGLTEIEPIDVYQILKKKNILALFRPLGDSFSGMVLKTNKDEAKALRFLLVNTSQTKGRINFTICHEFYHLFYQTDFEYSTSDIVGKFDSRGDQEEYAADCFAAHLLLPESGVLAKIPLEESKGNISIKTIFDIEQHFKCSRSALLVHLLKNKLITKELFEKYNNGSVLADASHYGYDDNLYKKDERSFYIGDYVSLSDRAFDEGIISESHYYSLLHDLGIDLDKLNCNE